MFVKVHAIHSNAKALFVNLSAVESLEQYEQHTAIVFCEDRYISVSETPEQILSQSQATVAREFTSYD